MYVWKDEDREKIQEYLMERYKYQQKDVDYYAKRKYGKWTIYNKEGWRVAYGLNEKEKNNYMKLLKKEE